MKKKYIFALLAVITLLGFFLRFYDLAGRPASLARDEVSAAYNAYSIIHSGKDEQGKVLPLAFKAFGDWKLPVEIYFVIPGIALFGLNDFSARLPEALLGSLSVPLLFLVIKKLTKNEILALLGTLFLAISPWHIYMSRVAIGYNVLGLFFFLGGIYFIFSFLEGNKKNIWFANLCFILTLFSYTAFHIFTPLFLVGFYLLYRKHFPFNRFILIQGVVFIIAFAIAIFSILEADTQKIAGTSLWSDPSFTYAIDELRNEHSDNSILTRFVHNKPLVFVQRLATNYAKTFSAEFLVVRGGENGINNLKEMGNMYIVEYFLLFLGLGVLLYKREKTVPFVLLWLGVGALLAIFTKEAPHSTRNLLLVPIFSFLAGYGLYSIVLFLNNPDRKIKFSAIAVIVFICVFGLFNIAYFLDSYFYHMPKERGFFWNAGFKEAVLLSDKLNPNKVVMGDKSRSPYIYFLFYKSYDPKQYVSEVVRSEPTWDNFEFINQFGKYFFVDDVDFAHGINEKNTLYIDRVEKIPQGYPLTGTFADVSGTNRFGYVYTNNDYCTQQSLKNKPSFCL